VAFIALETAVELVKSVREAHQALVNKDPDLANQLKRAAASVPLNIGEGRMRIGKDRLHHYRVAAGSAEEVRIALRVAEAWGDLAPETTVTPIAVCDRVLAMLWKLTR
jgi:four helix bundle protein